METKEDTEMLGMNAATDKKKRPKVVIRKAAKKNGNSVDLVPAAQSDDTGPVTEQPVTEYFVQDVAASESTGEAVGEHRSNDGTPASPPGLPPVPGFDLTNVSRNQQYAIRVMLVLCDCCVQGSAEAVFDVLARNFDNTGALCWWLRRIGKGVLVPRLKGKDIFDAGRIVAHALHKELKSEIGLPIPRW